jgi:hypothetical protein
VLIIQDGRRVALGTVAEIISGTESAAAGWRRSSWV